MVVVRGRSTLPSQAFPTEKSHPRRPYFHYLVRKRLRTRKQPRTCIVDQLTHCVVHLSSVWTLDIMHHASSTMMKYLHFFPMRASKSSTISLFVKHCDFTYVTWAWHHAQHDEVKNVVNS